MNPALVSVVIVTWNCRTFVGQCLDSLREHLHFPSEIIVVDNASTDGTGEMIRERFPAVVLLQNDANLGFAKGNNLGIRESTGRYIALINPDVVILRGCFEQALEAMEGDPSIGMLGPAMIGRDGAVHRSGMCFPSLWRGLCDALALHRIVGPRRIVAGQFMADFAWDRTRDVDILNGWFWLVRRDAVDHVGLLDERFFMYGEDLDWCRRLTDAGWRLVFEPRASAIHYGGGSSEQAPARFYLEMQHATLQYWHKHHGFAKRAVYSLILWLHHLLRTFAYGVVSFCKPNDSRPRLKMRLHALCLVPHTIYGSKSYKRTPDASHPLP